MQADQTLDMAEKQAVRQSPERIEELVAIFIKAIKLEVAFWEMGLQAVKR